jgi:sigma-B regulation protein RsbU (phosphoserine phosphatase)
MGTRTHSSSRTRNGSDSAFEMTSLFEFSNVVNASMDLKFILGHFLLTLMGKLLSLRALVLLAGADRSYRVETVKGLPAELIGKRIEVGKIPRRLVIPEREDPLKLPWITFFKEHGITLLVPLITREKAVGVAGFAPAHWRGKTPGKERTYVRSLANIAAAAIEKGLFISQLSQLNRRLDGKIQELHTLFSMSKEFNAELDADRLVKLLMFSVMGQIGATRFIICLEREGAMRVVASRPDQQLPPDLCGHFSTIASPVRVDELSRKGDRKMQPLLQELGIKILVPLQLQNKTKGMLAVGEKMRAQEYTPADLQFLFSLGNLAIISLENARLFKEAIEKQKMEDELLIAKEIQRGLLPATLPEIPSFDIAAVNLSSKLVGGDYYDVIRLSADHHVLAIGDVSGKGTPASLLMANLQATIRALVPLGLSLPDLTQRVNDLICENTGADRFITFFWGILHTGSRSLNYVDAGHNPPFLFRADGRTERLDKGGIILGIMKTTIPYEEGEVSFRPGDVLVLFTDGVSESMNLQGEELGEEPIEQVTRASLDQPAGVILSRIVDAVKKHSVHTPQSDDITLLVIKAMA